MKADSPALLYLFGSDQLCRVLRLYQSSDVPALPPSLLSLAHACAHTHPRIHMLTCTGTVSGGRVVAETSVKTSALLRLQSVSLVLRKAVSGLF